MRAAPQHGMTLIELMVGMSVGLLTTLAITQVMALAEGQRRSAVTGSAAQVDGAVAMYALQRDVQMAGYGVVNNPAALGCPVRAQFGTTAARQFPLVPVLIQDGGADGTSDSIAVLAGSKGGASVPLMVAENHGQTATNFVVRSAFSVAAGDLLVAVPATWDATANRCTLFAATGVNLRSVVHAGVVSWNAAQGSLFPAAGYPAQSYLVNLGSMVYRTYSVKADGSALQTNQLSAATGQTSLQSAHAHIVNLQALYGIDTNADGVVDAYSAVSPTTAAGWQQVASLRIAVAARSTQYEKEAVTASQPTWSVRLTATADEPTALTLKVDHLADWQHYRYKVYETVVPLRNMLWNS
ncbi:PilW family protein [Xylophilus sp. Leaf220]|uniref:PilW family protein n=1 Tax=Xylophilus sp. Leaf220 TaxID=1735686 RepID=UPI0006FDEA36|nr:PilW family protein [Xylophilus sp. Leaf220]